MAAQSMTIPSQTVCAFTDWTEIHKIIAARFRDYFALIEENANTPQSKQEMLDGLYKSITIAVDLDETLWINHETLKMIYGGTVDKLVRGEEKQVGEDVYVLSTVTLRENLLDLIDKGCNVVFRHVTR